MPRGNLEATDGFNLFAEEASGGVDRGANNTSKPESSSGCFLNIETLMRGTAVRFSFRSEHRPIRVSSKYCTCKKR